RVGTLSDGPSVPRSGLRALPALVDDDGDVTAALEDGCGAAIGARGEALRRGTLVDPRALHVERVDLDALAVRGVGDGGLERLRDQPRAPLRRVLEDPQRRLDGLAADHVHHQARLLRRDAREPARGTRFHAHFPAGAATAPSTFPLRSPEWPWNVRVGANSP